MHLYLITLALPFAASVPVEQSTTYAFVGDPKVKSMPENVSPVDFIKMFSPKVWIKDGCNPLTAFDKNGGIRYITGAGALWDKGCHSRAALQMYARQGQVQVNGEAQQVIVYAWLAQIEWPKLLVRDVDWQYMAVIPTMNGVPTTIWTPLEGFVSNYLNDFSGYYPWVVQAANKDGVPGIRAVGGLDHPRPADLLSLPLINVDGEGWDELAKWKMALDVSRFRAPQTAECPLSRAKFDALLQRIMQGTPVGYPVPRKSI